MTSLIDNSQKVLLPVHQLVVTVTSWETGRRREPIGAELMWTYFVLEFSGLEVPIKCLLDIGPLEPTLKREPRKVELVVRDGRFSISSLYVGNYSPSDNPWVYCFTTN